ncbi:MAG: autotransporter outer membrane beta-barrel domain-containing protein [Campylobacter sp.]|nr:autotransporter outer membrane beta-barrel domain-containing protein [Campylobacter sp.]
MKNKALKCSVFAALVLSNFLYATNTPKIHKDINYPMPNNAPFVHLYYLDIGEKIKLDDESTETSGWLPDEYNMKYYDRIKEGVDYWAYMLNASTKNTKAAKIAVAFKNEEDDNACAVSDAIDTGYYTKLGSLLIKNEDLSTDDDPYSGIIVIDLPVNRSKDPDKPTTYYTDDMENLPRNNIYSDLTSTLIHEIAHAMGLSTNFDNTKIDGKDAIVFSKNPTIFGNHIYDIYGTQAKPGMQIESVSVTKQEQRNPDAFNLIIFDDNNGDSNGGAHYKSENITKLLTITDEDGKEQVAKIYFSDNDYIIMPDYTKLGYIQGGIPINSTELDGDETETSVVPELSHIELQNVLESHQTYRNYNTFTQAELVIMNDMGYNIDINKFYGSSLYNSGVSYINNNAYNELSPWGVGFHIYGTGNIIKQNVALNADGKYGIGIRMDGTYHNAMEDDGIKAAGNTLYINAPVSANGYKGQALVVSYGKEHDIVLNSSLSATGEKGKAAVFDFGSNKFGNGMQYRGSYTVKTTEDDGTIKYEYPTNKNLNGVLVNNFNIAGTITSSNEAIYISENALVKNINVLSGAKINGDIISKWDPDEKILQYIKNDGKDAYTYLNFGVLPNFGENTIKPDSKFTMSYDGDITGSNIAVTLLDGKLNYGGNAKVFNFDNQSDLNLLGTLNAQNIYEHGANATLSLAFDKCTPSSNDPQCNGKNIITTSLQAGSYDIKGGKLTLRPEFKNLNAPRLQNGSLIAFKDQAFGEASNNFEEIYTDDDNIFEYEIIQSNGGIELKPTLRSNAFIADNSDSNFNTAMAGVMANTSTPNNAKYDTFFNTYAMSKDTKAINNSVAQNHQLDIVANSLRTQNTALLDNLGFLNSFNDGEIATAINTKYRRVKGNDYKANDYELSLNVAKLTSNGHKLGAYLNTGSTNFKKSLNDNDEKDISAGMQASFNTGYFDVISSVNLGYGKAKTKHDIYGVQAKQIKGDFNAVKSGFALGVSKTHFINNELSARADILGTYTLFRQGAYSESGEIFTRKFEKQKHQIFGTSVGGALEYNKALSNASSLGFGGFAYYNFANKNELENKFKFSDDPKGTSMNQKIKFDRHSAYLGANVKYKKGGFYVKFGANSNLGKEYKAFEVKLNAGLSF